MKKWKDKAYILYALRHLIISYCLVREIDFSDLNKSEYHKTSIRKFLDKVPKETIDAYEKMVLYGRSRHL